MEYYVIAPDGQQYGPASMDMLRQWVAENRITQATMLRHGPTGQTGNAGSVPGLFTSPAPVMAAPVASTPAYDPTFAAGYQLPTQAAQPQVQNSNPYSQASGVDYSRNPYDRPQEQWGQSAARAKAAGDYSADRHELMGIIWRVGLVILMSLIFRYGSIIVTGYTCYYAFTNFQGNRYGIWMILLAILAVCISAATWIFNMRGVTGM